MKGDFTRDTFDPLKHFSRVLMQQGRVQLDADWNEQTSILLHYLRTLATDILGPHAGPVGNLGFDLIPKGESVDWERIEQDESRREYLKDAVGNGDMLIGAGRYYVQGVLVENARPILFSEQSGHTSLDELKKVEWLAYLDVWERHITWVQDPGIREVALRGADTCTRAQVVWRVRIRTPENGENIDCDSLPTRAKPPKIRARARKEDRSPDLCSMSPESKYRGLENHLYRVEIHEIFDHLVTFKWSRENGSVVLPIDRLSGSEVIVSTLGRDECTLLKPGDWVEVCDEHLSLSGLAGPLARVTAVEREDLRITVEWPMEETPVYNKDEVPDKHPHLRRWDHEGGLEVNGALQVEESDDIEEGWIDLEDGVQIWFAKDGEYRVGDYWLIPARVATGDVEWPHADEKGKKQRLALPPHGPRHFFAPLFLKTGDGYKDCRCPIKSLPCVK